MITVELKLDEGIPQYDCSSCRNCQSVFGKSLCSIKNRGCCWYFPKFSLYEIHRMVKTEEGLKNLNNIISLPKTKVYNYYIHAEGYFDEAGYNEYIKNECEWDTKIKDKTIFFRACPFVNPGIGCTLPRKYRSYVCNFFICDDILKKAEKYQEFRNYINERNSYVKWIEWENASLEALFVEQKINLINNFEEIIDILKDIPLRECEFRKLEPVKVFNETGDKEKLKCFVI